MRVEFVSLTVLEGEELRAEVGLGDSSAIIVSGLCSFKDGVLSLSGSGALEISAVDVENCDFESELAEKGNAVLDSLTGTSVAIICLRNGTSISLRRDEKGGITSQ
jgi:hypothetical protein